MTEDLDWFAKDRAALAAVAVTDYPGDPAKREAPSLRDQPKPVSMIDLMLALGGAVARRQHAGDEILNEPVRVRLNGWHDKAAIVVGDEIVAEVPVS
jgi:hypothetical protein